MWCLGKANWKASKCWKGELHAPKQKRVELQFILATCTPNQILWFVLSKKFIPLEVCVGYSFPMELTTYNVSTKSNILVKCNKAKINKQILVVRIWHKVHTLQQITIYLTKKIGQKYPKWHLSTWPTNHTKQVNFDMSNLIKYFWLDFFTSFFVWVSLFIKRD